MSKARRIVIALAVILFITAVAGAFLLVYIYSDINFEADERMFDSSRAFSTTTFYADVSDGGDYLPVEIELSGSILKQFSPIEDISRYLTDGFVAVEDKKFYSHKGVDIKRTAMATLNYVFGRKKVFGASTITQQVVKNVSGDNQLKIKRKAQEIIRAFNIEEKYTKTDILEVYLNVVPMGENIYGVTAASRIYFGKEPSELTPAEAATLIGITNAPTAYNLYSNSDACRRKRNIVLSVMHNDGVITDSEYNEAVATPLTVIARSERSDKYDSWFVETVIDTVSRDLADKYDITLSAARIMLLGGGYKVYTTMNPEVQSTLEGYFENKTNFPKEIDEGLNYAMTVIDSRTGDLVGIIGRVGPKRADRLLNHATVPHIPASTLKPLALYAPLIDEGRINWSSVFDDVPVSFYESGGEYREYPRNSPAVYDGLITVKDALRCSKNTVAVRLCNILGVREIYSSLIKDYGFDSLIEKEGDLTDIAISPLALGQLSRGISLLKLTEGYSVLSGDGLRREARCYVKVLDYNDELILDREQYQERIYKPTTARIMTQLLKGVVDSGTASAITLKNITDVAGKTGTSSGSREKTFVGFTPYYTAGIWCGYDSGERAAASLSKGHLEIWDEVMHLLHEDVINNDARFSTEGLLYLPYCMDSGELYSDVCRFDPRGNRREYGYFTPDNQPGQTCKRHILCLYDPDSKGVATPECPREGLIEVALIYVGDRHFPKQIYVTDAEFVYRDIGSYIGRPIDQSLPYFAYALPEGEYAGVSKREKQFNSSCVRH